MGECTCDHDHVEHDEHRPWCGGPNPAIVIAERAVIDEADKWVDTRLGDANANVRLASRVLALRKVREEAMTISCQYHEANNE